MHYYGFQFYFIFNYAHLKCPSDLLLTLLFNQHEVDGKAYYSFEFVAQAPNFTRHAVGTICIGNGMYEDDCYL